MASQDLKVLFPGREVEIDPIGTVTVFPLGFIHLRRFNQAVEGVLPRILSQVGSMSVKEVTLDKFMPMILPILLGECLDLLNECVPDLDLLNPHLPHFIVPQIAEVWIEESFIGEGKVEPWIQAVTRVMERLNGTSATPSAS